MASNLKFISCILLSACLGLCWLPLSQLTNMQIESSQLLFFAFSAASLVTIGFMACQVEKWRHNTLDLLIFALTGGVSNVSLHYSLLHGNPIVVLSLFSLSMVAALFLVRLAKGQNLVATEFITVLALLLVAISTLMTLNSSLKFHWSQVLAVLAAAGFYRLFTLNGQKMSQIPIVSKLSALFIASTWLVGMVLIFSPRSASFPQEHATLYSALYGTILLVPIVASIIYIFSKNNFMILLLWITVLLSANLIGLYLYQGNGLVWPLLLLIPAYIIQVMRFKASPDTKDA